jgi:hypothetical protein
MTAMSWKLPKFEDLILEFATGRSIRSTLISRMCPVKSRRKVATLVASANGSHGVEETPVTSCNAIAELSCG